MIKKLLFFAYVFLGGLTFSYSQSISPTPSGTTTDPGQIINLKNHFEQGMKDFQLNSYEFALPELIAATSVQGVFPWQTWYVSSYTTMGVIYEFHSKDPKNKAYAYMYYSLALARDPNNVTANLYIKDVLSSKSDALAILATPTPLADGTLKTNSESWIPAPMPKDSSRSSMYSINSFYKWDASGSTLETLGDIFVHKKLDQYSTTGDLWIRVSKDLSSSDTIGSVDLWEGKITFLEPWLQFSVGRFDIFSTVTPGSFFGNYPLMGLHRVDGAILVLPLFFKVGIDNLDSFQSPPLSLTFFYTPSLLEAQDVKLDTDQAFFFTQLRFRLNVFGLLSTFRTNMGWTNTDYFTYSSLNGGFTFSEALDVTVDNNLSVYGEFGDQNPALFNETDVAMAGIKLSKLATFGPLSLDSFCVEIQLPLENSSNNIFSGANPFNHTLAQNSANTYYGGAKFRLQDIAFDLGITNNVDDFTLNRVNQTNSIIPNVGPIGPGRENELGIPIVSPSTNVFAFLFDAGINF